METQQEASALGGCNEAPRRPQENALKRPTPELTLLIDHREEGGLISLHFHLWVQNTQLESVGEVTLQEHPIAKLRSLFERLQGMSLRDGEARRVARHHLDGLGAVLGTELLPEKLRSRLWRIWQTKRAAGNPAATMLLLSNETWVPWELLRLQKPEDATPGPFLVEVFACSRWLLGPTQTLELPGRSIGLVVPSDSGLALASTEQQMVHSLESDERIVTDVRARLAPLVEALASGAFDTWHFCGHGVAGRDQSAYVSSLQLERGQRLIPSDLAAKAHSLGGRRPLVFLNACHSARADFTLTGVGGWACAFLEAGAGAFIASHWALRDEQALAFAEAFYERLLLRRVPIGEALRSTRHWFQEQYPGDPTWLAYALFAHPQASADRLAAESPEPWTALVSPWPRQPAGEQQGETAPIPAPITRGRHRSTTPWRTFRLPFFVGLGLVGFVLFLSSGYWFTPLDESHQEAVREAAHSEELGQSGSRSTPSEPVGTMLPTDNGADAGVIEILKPGSPKRIAGGAVVAAQFKELLGSDYAELLVSREDAPPLRQPVRSVPTALTFNCGSFSYELQVIHIDWQRKEIQVVVRSSVWQAAEEGGSTDGEKPSP